MQMGIGNGGWVRVDDPDLPGPLYIRYRIEHGRPIVVEFYLDARGAEITSGLLRNLNLSVYTSLLLHEKEDDHVEYSLMGKLNMPGPDLSTLASYYSTTFGRQARSSWVVDSMHAQIMGSGVDRPGRGEDPEIMYDPEPDPVAQPLHGLDDEFLRSVAANYRWALRLRLRPATTIARQSQSPVRTVHSWIRKARKHGFIAPTTQGRSA